MKWEAIQSTSEHEVYQLLDSGKKQLQMIYSPFAQSVRIDCNNTKRVFFIRREGFLKNKIVIRNEYGVRIGEMGQENRQNFIIVHDKKVFYTSDTQMISLSNPGELAPFTYCETGPVAMASATSLSKSKHPGNTHPGLMMALCWYLFLPVRKEREAALLAIS